MDILFSTLSLSLLERGSSVTILGWRCLPIHSKMVEWEPTPLFTFATRFTFTSRLELGPLIYPIGSSYCV